MDAFLAGTDVTLVVPLLDKSGNRLVASSISFRVINETGVEVMPSAAADFQLGAETVSLPIPASVNALDATAARGLRIAELTCIIAGNTVIINGSYVVELSDPLQVGVSSFQTYAQAEFTALEIVNIPGWDAAPEMDRIAALMEARRHIVQLNFSQLNSNVNWGQDSLNFVPEGTYSTNFVSSSNSMFMFNGSLELLTAPQFAKLPEKFKMALRLAQIAEADAILGGDPVEQKRREGIVADFVGESKQMYRQSKPLQLPVSRRALGYLSYFVTFSKRIGRN